MEGEVIALLVLAGFFGLPDVPAALPNFHKYDSIRVILRDYQSSGSLFFGSGALIH